ncbi:TRAP transporter small permease [Vibrio spartinae]|uniref:TRAP transporter small permease protein n=1 Tax=Vibrio spartinae TaxID=1918945 RepID=A0A1N6M9B2_9VIBR|nr:TRAP transporter small permease [Vibrio spartinae]QMV16193.1 2,3-diketo-L-gulonate TRAP transporter small permease protein YiaM [Vibrio spartinae]SIO95940.1 2,3-diketo-L-gulonate TRAP transporter small permease protein YiaM [Vibrio spartinae]
MEVMNVSKINQKQGCSSALAVVVRIESIADKLLGYLAAIGLVALSSVVLLQIFGRLFLDTPPAWTEELSRYLFIGTVAISVGIAYKRGELVSVELLVNALSQRHAHLFSALVAAIIFIFSWILYPSAVQFAQIGQFQLSPTMFIPMSYVFYSTVVILVNLMFFSALGFIRHLLNLFNAEAM